MRRREWHSPGMVLVVGGLVLMLAMGVRHSFGLFLQPMSTDLGWGRETFAFAIALQNLLWGVTQPFTGMIADRYGAGRVLIAGAMLYVGGLVVMAFATSGLGLSLGAGVLIGVGLSGTTFSVIYGVIGRSVTAEKRSMALGIAGAAGSFGQFIMLPYGQILISNIGWFSSLLVLAATAALMAPLSAALVEKRLETDGRAHQSVGAAIREAFGYRSFLLLNLGFFVCGFQVVFIAVHLPAFLLDQGLSANDGVRALALIGLFNIAGTLGCGMLGGRYSKKYLLAALYLSRSAVIIAFLAAPITALSSALFAAAMGLLWLGTVPLTNGLVAQIFGVRHLSMLSGFVFFSHQIGSFLGAWLGGYLFDASGSYQLVWSIAIGLGVMAALANWPIDERQIERAAPARAMT